MYRLTLLLVMLLCFYLTNFARRLVVTGPLSGFQKIKRNLKIVDKRHELESFVWCGSVHWGRKRSATGSVEHLFSKAEQVTSTCLALKQPAMFCQARHKYAMVRGTDSNCVCVEGVKGCVGVVSKPLNMSQGEREFIERKPLSPTL